MWTEITRPKYERSDRRYASDLSDAEWGLIAPYMMGRPRTTALRDVQRHPLPVPVRGDWDFPPRSTVQPTSPTAINRQLLMTARAAEGRNASPWPALSTLISQDHRKRRPTGFRCWQEDQGAQASYLHRYWRPAGHRQVHGANVQDRDGAPVVLASVRRTFPRLRHVFADQAYSGPKLATALLGRWRMEIVKHRLMRTPLKSCRRTLAWLNRNRRLAKDFETTLATAQTWLFLARYNFSSGD